MTDPSAQSPEVALIRHLRARGFTVHEGREPGDYVVAAHGDTDLPLRPRLTLPPDLLAEYLDTLDSTPGATPPGLDALALAEVHLEEKLTTAGPDGRNHARDIGLHRVRGRVEWFVRHATPDDPRPTRQNLEWRPDPPR